MNQGEAFDDLRLVTADAIREVGSALQHAAQALDMAEAGTVSPADWQAAADAFMAACELLGDCEQIARAQGKEQGGAA